MAEITLLSYLPGRSALHRCDPRVKILLMLPCSISVFLCGGFGLVLLTLGISLPAVLIGRSVPGRSVWKQFRGVLILAAAVLLGRTFFGETGPGSIEGLSLGLLGAWRLMLFFTAGFVLMTSTGEKEIRDAVASILRPVPFVRERRTALMLGMTVTFIPMIFKTASTIREIHAARGMESTGRPIRRTAAFTGHVVTAILRRASFIADSIESRAYDENGKAVPMPRPSGGSVIGGVVFLIFLGGVLAADHLLAGVWTLELIF